MTESRIAIVTGASRGIGRAIAVRLSRGGTIPVLGYRGEEAAAAEALAEVRGHTPEAFHHRADVADPAAVGALVEATLGAFGRIDVLVHAAFRGGRPPRKVHEIPLEAWAEDLGTNLTGAFLAARACLPSMVARGHGRIVFIGSLAAGGERGRAAYSTAKSGLIGLARTIAKEYARDGITANVVSPGFIEAGAFLRLDPAIRERARTRVPGARFGTAEEVAEAVAYLASPEAGYTTGHVLGVDGGAV